MSKEAYSPRDPLNRDFSPDLVFYDGSNGVMPFPVMLDPDLEQLAEFYRESVVNGTLLNVGCGPMHFHYMVGLLGKVTQFTGLDISQKNLDAVREFAAAIQKKPIYRHLLHADTVRLHCFTDWAALHLELGLGGSAENILQELVVANTRNGALDLIQGNMFDLDMLLGDREFDNILFGFCIFAENTDQVVKLFKAARRHLSPNGRMIVAEYQGFTKDDMADSFEEDEPVFVACPDPMDFNEQILTQCLVDAGFDYNHIRATEYQPQLDGPEQDHGFTYLLLTADNG